MISYAELLDVFWSAHNPRSPSISRQYRSAIFFHDDQQRRLAEESKKRLQKARRVFTDIEPLSEFYMAEDYHQKYMLKQHSDLKGEMTKLYPLHRDFVDSTAVARLNGYAGGHGSQDQLKREIDRLGLSASGRKALTEMVNRKSNYDRR